jgi:hypothetical protein
MTLLLTLDDGSIHRKLVDAVELARAAAAEEAEVERVGAYVGVEREDAVSVSHLFEAGVPGYRGWRWSVTVATADEEAPVTVSEVVLMPGPDALVAPAWIPWERRVQAGDLGVGDIFPTDKDDPRLAPAYLASDDPAVEEVAVEAGLGRVQVLSRFGREDVAARWQDGDFGPRSDMARSAPFTCGTCGFYLPLAGSLRGAFGVCTNDISPADGHAVNVEYGCGAHSEIEVEVSSSIPVAELVYDSSLIDVVEITPDVEVAEAAAPVELAEAEVAPVEAEGTEAAEAPPVEVAEAAEVVPAEPEVAGPEAVEAEAAPVEADTVEPEVVEPEVVEADVTDAAGAAPVETAAVEADAGETDAGETDAASVEAEASAPVENVVAETGTAEASAVGEPSAETPVETEQADNGPVDSAEPASSE